MSTGVLRPWRVSQHPLRLLAGPESAVIHSIGVIIAAHTIMTDLEQCKWYSGICINMRDQMLLLQESEFLSEMYSRNAALVGTPDLSPSAHLQLSLLLLAATASNQNTGLHVHLIKQMVKAAADRASQDTSECSHCRC